MVRRDSQAVSIEQRIVQLQIKKKREYEKKFNFKFTIQSAPSTIHSFIHVVNRIIIYASVLQTFLFACVDQSIGTVTFFNGQFLPFSIDA